MKNFRVCIMTWAGLNLLFVSVFGASHALAHETSSNPDFSLQCAKILTGSAHASVTEKAVALAKKLIIDKNALPDSAIEGLLASPIPRGLLDFGFQNLSTQELGALRTAMRIIFSKENKSAMDWERVKKEIGDQRDSRGKNARQRHQSEEDTATVFSPIKVGTYKRSTDVVGHLDNGAPMLVAFGSGHIRWKQRGKWQSDDAMEVYSPAGGGRYISAGHMTWDYNQFPDGTLYETFTHESDVIIHEVKTNSFTVLPLKATGLEVPGVDFGPMRAVFTSADGKKKMALAVYDDVETRVAVVDLATGQYEKFAYKGEKTSIFAAAGRLYIINHKPDPGLLPAGFRAGPGTVVVEEIGPVPRIAGIFRVPRSKEDSVIHKVFETSSGKTYMFFLSDHRLTAVNLTDGTQNTFENVSADSTGVGSGKLSESADGRLYYHTFTQPYTGVGATVYDLNTMTSREIPRPARLKKDKVEMKLVHLPNGKSYALLAVEKSGRLQSVLVHSLNEEAPQQELPVADLDLMEFVDAWVTPDGRVEGYFDSTQGLIVVQLFGRLPKAK